MLPVDAGGGNLAYCATMIFYYLKHDRHAVFLLAIDLRQDRFGSPDWDRA